MTTLHFIETFGVICRGAQQDSYEQWTALLDGKDVEDFRPGNRVMAQAAREELLSRHPDANVVCVEQRIDWSGTRMLSGARSEIIA